MAKINKYGRIFLKNIAEKYKISATVAALKKAMNDGTIPEKDAVQYRKLITSSSASIPWDQAANEMGYSYVKKLNESRKSAMNPPKPATSGASKPTVVSPSKPTTSGASKPTGPSKPLGDKDIFYDLTGDKVPKTDAEKRAEKLEKGQTLLDTDQQEALKAVIASNEQQPQEETVGGGWDQFAAQQLNNLMPNATGQIAQPQRFGEYSDSNLLNAYDAMVNSLSRGRSRSQDRLATIAPWLTGAASIAGGVGGGLLGAKVGGPGVGGMLGARGAGHAMQGALGYFTTPKTRMEQLADIIAPRKDYKTAVRTLWGNTIAGRTSGLSNYIPNPFAQREGFMGKLGRFIGGKPTFSQNLRATMTNPNLASNVRTGLEVAVNLYDIANELGLNKYAKKALNSITRKIGMGGLADRLGLSGPASPTATGKETGQQLGGNIVEGLMGRHFDPRISNREALLENARAMLSPMETDYDIKRQALQRREREEGILGEGQRKLSTVQQQRDAVRRQAQEQKFGEKRSIQDLRDEEAAIIATANAQNRRMDTTGISLGQKAQPVPIRRQGYIPSPTSEQIAETAQRVQEITAPHLFRRD